MRILILGADGFIGRHIAFHLRAKGHEVVASARRIERLKRMGFETVVADLSRRETHSSAFWSSKTHGITHVVNAAGVLNGSETRMRAIHIDAPEALYDALPKDVPIVLLSAISIDNGETLFARVRLEAERNLIQRGGIAVRPGLVLADTTYGGSSLGRALAALPWVLPVIGGGKQQINPIHAADLSDIILNRLKHPVRGEVIEIGGSEIVTQAEMLGSIRDWLGLPHARLLNIPKWLARLIGHIGDTLHLGSISATFSAMLDAGALAKPSPTLTPRPRGFSQFLWQRPAGTQDLWTARLFLVKPLLRIVLAVMWLTSGLIGLFLPKAEFLPIVIGDMPEPLLIFLARGGGILDLVIAVLLLKAVTPRLTALVQFLVVIAYTLGLTILAPALWLLPMGGVLKNLPILILLLVHLILEEER